MKPQRRTAEHRFAATYTDRQLFELVRRVLVVADAVAPLSVTEHAFDQARLTGDAEGPFKDVPAARHICSRLSRRRRQHFSWRLVKETALKDETARVQTLVAAERADDDDSVSLRHIFFALNHVARELHVNTLSEEEYTAGRDELLAADRRRSRSGGLLEELLPTAHQIRRFAGTWEMALAIAELAVLKREVIRPRVSFPDGLPVPEAIVAFVEVNGRYPGREVLIRWMADCDAKLRSVTKPWSTYLDQAGELLRQRRLPVPDQRPTRGRPKKGEKPFEYQLPPGGRIPGTAPRDNGSGRKVETWTTEKCIEALAEWDRELDPAVDRDTRQWVEDSRGRPDRPGRETIRRKGGFAALLKQAQARNRRGRR